MGAGAMAYTPIEAVPGWIRMQRLAHDARMALVPPAIGAHDPHWPAQCPITGCQVVRGMTLLDNLRPRSVALRRKGRPLPTLEVLVAQ